MSPLAILRYGILAVTLTIGVLPHKASHSEDYHPLHPDVLAAVKRGSEYLATKKVHSLERHPQGVELLVALAMYKGDEAAGVEHPRIKRGIELAVEIASRFRAGQYNWVHDSMYSVPVAGMLLTSIDPVLYAEDIRAIRDNLIASQRPHGGFGYMQEGMYKQRGQGDISQTQYVTLCLWTFAQAGFEIPEDSLVKCLNFLETAQQPTGAWAYQYPPAGTDDSNATNSRTAAGLSAYLIASDTLGLFKNKVQSNPDEEGLVPSVFRRVDLSTKRKAASARVDITKVDSTIQKCMNWIQANPYRRAGYHYYYVYSQERYESFLELSRGTKSKSPPWYNTGVEDLFKLQNADGSWGTKSGDVDGELGPDTCTSFAILFLIRSTQRAIGQLHDDTLLGGHGLPEDPTSVVVRNGRILDKTVTTTIDDALKLLEDDSQLDGKDRLIPDQLVLPTDRKQRREQLTRFSRLMNSKDVLTRRFAAKLLGRGDDLEFVPSLIYGLSDPDQSVARSSENSLRLISRRLETHYLPKEGEITLNQRNGAMIQWREWYKTVRPDYVFAD